MAGRGSKKRSIEQESTSDEVPSKFRKEDERLSWEQYFMGIALISAERSKDPKRQVGACIVNENKRILAIGYNGMPDNIKDSDDRWDPDAKEKFVCHAELNAVLNRGANDVSGCTMYVTYYPCSNCAKVIIQSRIKEVVYYDIYSEKRKDDAKIAEDMLRGALIRIMPYKRQEGELMIKASGRETGNRKNITYNL